MIPILKKGKNKSRANSYRPISLTSCLGKLMERRMLSFSGYQHTVAFEEMRWQTYLQRKGGNGADGFAGVIQLGQKYHQSDSVQEMAVTPSTLQPQ